MRSQLLVLSMISIAVSGCGKDVERSAKPISQGQQNVTPVQGGTVVETRPGNCADPIQTNFKKIERFSDVALAVGKYALTKLEAVGTASQSAPGTPSAISGISVITATPKADGKFDFKECRDLSAMPQGSYQWGVVAPNAIDAKDGAIAQEIHLTQTVFGPGLSDQNGPIAAKKTVTREAVGACGSMAEAMAGEGCAASTFYQIDSDTIGVLSTSVSTMNGMAIQSKVFARYSIVTGKAPTQKKPEPTKKVPTTTKPATSTKSDGGQGSQGNGSQGDGGQGSQVIVVQPTTTTPCCKTTTTVKPTTVTTVTTTQASTQISTTAVAETSKTKIHVKEVEVKQTLDGEEVTKVKLDVKTKSNSETGVEKEKVGLKVQTTTPTSQTKLKVKTKIKVVKRPVANEE